MPQLTQQQVEEIIRQAAQPAIQKYGIQDVGSFIQALVAIAYGESSWTTDAQGDLQPSGRYASQGLFQLLDQTDDGRQGRGFGMSVADRQDPAKNAAKAAEYLGAIWGDAEKKGQGTATAVERLVREGQIPADPASAIKRVKETMMGSADVTAGTALQPATTQQAGGNQDIIAWLKAHGFGSYVGKLQDGTEFPYDPGTGGSLPSWLGQLYGEATMGTTSGQAPEDIAYTKAQTGRTLAETAQIQQETGNYIPEQERKAKQQEFENKITQQGLDVDVAISQFNAWIAVTQEARARAEKEFDVAEKRAAWTTPGKYWPGQEPGGLNAQMYEAHGLPTYPSPEGVPISQMPSLEATYNKWQGNMGVSQNAPAMAGVSTGPTESQSFFQSLIEKGKARQSQTAYTGWAAP